MQRGNALRGGLDAEGLGGEQQAELAADPAGPGERLVIGLGEAEVLHRVGDLAVLDREGAVARHAGHERAELVDPARVPEARDEHSALHIADELLA